VAVVRATARWWDALGVFERFTERARQAVVAAREEARELRHSHVGSEHLLLVLLRDKQCLAARALEPLGVTFERARREVVRRGASSEGPPVSGEIPFTPRAKQVLDRAPQLGLELGHNYAGSEHLLLGLADISEGEAINVLRDLGVDADGIREAVMRLISGPGMQPLPHRSRWRGGRRRAARASVAEESIWESGFQVVLGDDSTRLLMSAAAQALDDGRTEMTPDDLLIALSRDAQTGQVLAELGGEEAAIRAALKRGGTSQKPPEADAGS
jgi:ClpA/ClpB-like protein